LEFLAIKHKNELESTSLKHKNFSTELKLNLTEIIKELGHISHSITNSSLKSNQINNLNSTNGASSLENKLIEQNKELINSIKKLSDEKIELKSSLSRLEDELWSLKNKSRAELSTLTEHDKEKFKKLYYKYLRAESFRKSLVYQKRFLLIMLTGYEETEREILATLKIDNQYSSYTNSNTYSSSLNSYNSRSSKPTGPFYSNKFTVHKAKSRFKTAVICVIAVSRIK
jgi:hypothetical protein